MATLKGYRCVLVMPEDMSTSRRQILRAYGAEVVLTPAQEGMAGAVDRADADPRGDRRRVHAEPVRERGESAQPLREHGGGDSGGRPPGKCDAFVAGVGTGGTLTGVGRLLKERRPDVKVVAVEPRASAVLSGGRPGLHAIQGLGAGFVPPVLDRDLIDEVVTVTDLASDRMTRRLAREEGLLLGPSSGANVHAAIEVAKRMAPGERVVTILCDGGERYLV